MDYIGGIEGMKFTPISNYNNYLNNNMSFDVDSNLDFENILNKQTNALQNPVKVQGGIEMNMNFDDILAQNSVKAAEDSSSTGTFMKSMSNSMSSGIGSVDSSVKASDRAQEAFAAGEDISVHDVMLASSKASLNLQMAMELRNKVLSAYSEINNIRV